MTFLICHFNVLMVYILVLQNHIEKEVLDFKIYPKCRFHFLISYYYVYFTFQNLSKNVDFIFEIFKKYRLLYFKIYVHFFTFIVWKKKCRSRSSIYSHYLFLLLVFPMAIVMG